MSCDPPLAEPNPMPNKSWQPTPQECELIVDMLEANRPKAAIAKYLFVSESTLRRFLARVRAARLARVRPDNDVVLDCQTRG